MVPPAPWGKERSRGRAADLSRPGRVRPLLRTAVTTLRPVVETTMDPHRILVRRISPSPRLLTRYAALASETARASRCEMKRLHQEIRAIREEQHQRAALIGTICVGEDVRRVRRDLSVSINNPK